MIKSRASMRLLYDRYYRFDLQQLWFTDHGHVLIVDTFDTATLLKYINKDVKKKGVLLS